MINLNKISSPSSSTESEFWNITSDDIIAGNGSILGAYFIFACRKPKNIDIFYFFLYLPSSGIAPCVGTADALHDSYTWRSPTYYTSREYIAGPYSELFVIITASAIYILKQDSIHPGFILKPVNLNLTAH